MFHSLQIYRPEFLHAFPPCVLHSPPISFALILPSQYKVTAQIVKLSKSSYLAIWWPSVLHCTLLVVTFSVYHFAKVTMDIAFPRLFCHLVYVKVLDIPPAVAFSSNREEPPFLTSITRTTFILRGADKTLARPGRKQATATKL